jgi:hypothetical protein
MVLFIASFHEVILPVAVGQTDSSALREEAMNENDRP